jgi:NAD(P)-dependent dehydrogenase (short-subunit alcohol dehydrogenase family)
MKTVVVTGATSGIGFAVAQALLALGWRVLLVGHTRENGEKALGAMREAFPLGEMACFYGDLMQQREVHRVADELSAYLALHAQGRLEALVNNAGAVRTWYTTTQEGLEQQFALNHLAGFLLTHRLMPALRLGGGRMLLTSSASHKHCRVHFDDIMYRRRRYSALGAYKQSKLCNVIYAAAFNRLYAAEGLRAYAVDPGLVATDIGFKQTGGLVKLVWALRKAQGVPAERPARTFAALCAGAPAPEGLYWYDGHVARHDPHADRTADQDRLFALSEKLCGIASFGGSV